MDIKELKSKILNKEPVSDLIIFTYEDSDYIAHQYIHAIADNQNWPVEVLQDTLKETSSGELEPIYYSALDALISKFDSIFEEADFDGSVKVYYADTFDYLDKRFAQVKNVVIVCKKLSKEALELYNSYICKIPKIIDWQLKDYAYSIADGVATNKLDYLIQTCPDLYALNNELSKLNIFTKAHRDTIFNNALEDGLFEHLSIYKIYDFTDAILKKNKPKLVEIYSQIKPANIDIEPLGVITLLINHFTNIIKVQLGRNPTAESVGVSSGQFYHLSKDYKGMYTQEQLSKIYVSLLGVDKLLKTGILDEDNIVDYILCKVFEV